MHCLSWSQRFQSPSAASISAGESIWISLKASRFEIQHEAAAAAFFLSGNSLGAAHPCEMEVVWARGRGRRLPLHWHQLTPL
jgi:hypothetical protein